MRRLYRVDRPALHAAISYRTPGAIQLHASHLKAGIRPRWTDEEEERLRRILNARLSLKKAAAALGRTEKAVYEHAHALGIAVGCPEGHEYLMTAMERSGFTNVAAFRQLLRRAGVAIHVSMSDPYRRGVYRRSFVDPFDVDEAVATWVASEPVNAAARARGLNGITLTSWLIDAGVLESRVGAGDRTQRRVASDVIDRVVAERRTQQARVELLGQEAA